jgi:outer membrane receptor for ferrienterochelin and colicins
MMRSFASSVLGPRVPACSAVLVAVLRLSPVRAEPVSDGIESSEASEAPQPLEAVVVTGSRTDRPLPVATLVISEREVAESGARSLAELLEERAGVYISRSALGAGAELQGLPPDYALILVDGVRVPGRVGGVIDLERYPIDVIERIEIVRGPSSALYGSDAIAGVINIITRPARRRLELGGRASLGPREKLDASAYTGTRQRHWSARLSAGHHSSAGFDLDTTDLATTASASEQWNVAQRSNWVTSEHFRLESGSEYVRRVRRGVDQSAAGAVFDRENLTHDASLWLRPEWALGAGSQFRVVAGYGFFRDDFRLDQRESDALDSKQNTREHLGQLGAQMDLALGESHIMTAGIDGSYESLTTERLGGRRAERERVALFVQDEWALLGAPLLVLLPSARLDVDSQFGLYPTPRLALRCDPARDVTLRATIGWGYKAPDFRELYLLFENPSAGYLVEGSTDLEPERSRSVNAGVEYRPHRSVWLSLQGFYNLIDDRIDTALSAPNEVGPQRFRYQNVDSATTRGSNAAISVTPLSGLRVELGYDFTDGRDGDGQLLSGVARHRATALVRYRASALGFETLWRGSFVGERPFYDDADGDGAEARRTAKGYASVDLRVAQRIATGWTSFMLAENVLDAGDPEFLPLAPRSFSGGIELEY